MDLHLDQMLYIQNQRGMIKERTARFPCDQEIEIAVLIRLTASDRTEDPRAMGSMPFRA